MGGRQMNLYKLPFKKGDAVRVISASDDTCLPEQIGKEGIIMDVNENGATGNTDKDPLFEVWFADGGKDSFWNEELQLIKAR